MLELATELQATKIQSIETGVGCGRLSASAISKSVFDNRVQRAVSLDLVPGAVQVYMLKTGAGPIDLDSTVAQSAKSTSYPF